MNYHYTVVQETYMDETAPRTAYGIAAVQTDDNCLVVMHSIADVCVEPAPLHQLVQCCNQLNLDLIHLQDVVDDFLAETP